jgi:hypothetical protein
LERLDQIPLVWGDVKAENISLDRNGKIWITDFGGSYIEDWIERELSMTDGTTCRGVELLEKLLQLRS